MKNIPVWYVNQIATLFNFLPKLMLVHIHSILISNAATKLNNHSQQIKFFPSLNTNTTQQSTYYAIYLCLCTVYIMTLNTSEVITNIHKWIQISSPSTSRILNLQIMNATVSRLGFLLTLGKSGRLSAVSYIEQHEMMVQN